MAKAKKPTLLDFFIEYLDKLYHDPRLSRVDQACVETISLSLYARGMGITLFEWEAQVAAEDEAFVRQKVSATKKEMDDTLSNSATTQRRVASEARRYQQRAASNAARKPKQSKLKRAA